MEKISSGNKKFTSSEIKNYLKDYGVEIEQVGTEIRIYGLNQNIDNAKGKIQREIFFENNKEKIKNTNNQPKPGGIAEQLDDINNVLDENNYLELNKNRNNYKYLEKVSLTF